jgi:hypothetical protein
MKKHSNMMTNGDKSGLNNINQKATQSHHSTTKKFRNVIIGETWAMQNMLLILV